MEIETDKLISDVFYKILECCFRELQVSRSDLAKYVNISENNTHLSILETAGLIQSQAYAGKIFSITGQGASVFLQLKAQHSSSIQSSKAIRIATRSVWVAIAALIVNIIMMIFNFL